MTNSSERIIDLRTKTKDFCTDTIIGIDQEILDFFIAQDKEEDIELAIDKAYLLVAYTYNWFFGLKNKRLEEQIFGLKNKRLEEQIFGLKNKRFGFKNKVLEFNKMVLKSRNTVEVMEFVENIWECYGDLSIEELEKMQAEESKVCKQSIPHHYYEVYHEMHEGTVIGETKLQLCTMGFPEYSDYDHLYYFHSRENEKIYDYLPPNVFLRLGKDGLHEIMKLEPAL